MEKDHVLPKILPVLELTEDERIAFIKKERWIGYPTAHEILNMMDDLLIYPQRHRMPNLLLVGDTNNGKTMILRRFLSLHPPDVNLEGDASLIPVFLIQTPPIPDEARLYRIILDHLFAPYRSRDKVENLQYQVLTLFRRVGVKIFIIDEMQHILAGTPSKQRHFLNVIKYMSNELMIPIVAAGVQDSLLVLRSDPQLSNRFKTKILPRWKLDTDYFRLLASFEKVLPLKKASHLTERNTALKLLTMTEGLLGELATLLSEAAIHAITKKTEQISEETLESIDWTSPSERRKTAERLRL